MESFKKAIDYKTRTVPQRPEAEILKDGLFPGFPRTLPTIKEAETLLIREAMKKAKGNQSIAARVLGITRQTLISKLRKMQQN